MMAKKEAKEECCKCGFPVHAVCILIIGILWLLSDLKILVINIPLLPIMAIVLALGMIRKHSMMHYMQMKR